MSVPLRPEPGFDVDVDRYLFDLDGTLFLGGVAVPDAVAAVERVGDQARFVTNNASRTQEQVVAHLGGLGFSATVEQVLTAGMIAAAQVAAHCGPGATVLVLGTDALRDQVLATGLKVTDTADDHPDAVLQGLNRAEGWAQLSEAALAIRAGAFWMAANRDGSLPDARGLLVGNGGMVAAVVAAVGREPDAVAGKPSPAIISAAAAGATRPLVIGDRIDTDIAAATAAGLPSLLVETGVHTAANIPEFLDRFAAPTYLASSLAVLGWER